MNFSFNEDQQMFRGSVREFFAKEFDTEVTRKVEKTPAGYSHECWAKMAELGWLGLTFPENYGGVGFGQLELAILHEELGRGCVPSPHLATVVLAGQLILAAGSEAQKSAVLPRIASGEMIVTVAQLEDETRWDAGGIKMTAEASGDGFALKGTKLFVNFVHVAHKIVVAARTAQGSRADDGVTLFLVDASAPGMSKAHMPTLGLDQYYEVCFDNVHVDRSAVIGRVGEGWAPLAEALDRARIAVAAQINGGCERALELAVEYSKVRVAFGKPIGAYQALQHKMAEMAMETDGAKLLTYEAAWMADQGLPYRKLAAAAKANSNETGRRVAADAIQVHGGYGFISEVDTTLYYRRNKALELFLGDSKYNRDLVADAMDL